MQITTSDNVRSDGRPFAATTSAPRANGSAKTVWEKRIRRRNRASPLGPIFDSPGRSLKSTSGTIKDRHRAVDAVGRSPSRESADHARKASVQFCRSEVFATTAAFLLRSSSTSQEEK